MDERDKGLPVTGEVGGEGGSYADATVQRATFADEQGIARTEGHGGASSLANQATRSETIAAGGFTSGDDPGAGLLRHPSEDPAGRSRRRPGPVRWRAGLMGAVVGAGAAFAAALLKRRR